MKKLAYGIALLALVFIMGCPMPLDVRSAGADARLVISGPRAVAKGAELTTPLTASPRNFVRSQFSFRWQMFLLDEDEDTGEITRTEIEGITNNRNSTFIPPVRAEVGDYEIVVTSTDGYIQSTARLPFFVIDESRVIIHQPTELLLVGGSTNIFIGTYLFEGTPVINWTLTGPESYTLSGTTQTIDWTIPQVPGTYVLNATATDGADNTDTGTIRLSVITPPKRIRFVAFNPFNLVNDLRIANVDGLPPIEISGKADFAAGFLVDQAFTVDANNSLIFTIQVEKPTTFIDIPLTPDNTNMQPAGVNSMFIRLEPTRIALLHWNGATFSAPRPLSTATDYFGKDLTFTVEPQGAIWRVSLSIDGAPPSSVDTSELPGPNFNNGIYFGVAGDGSAGVRNEITVRLISINGETVIF